MDRCVDFMVMRLYKTRHGFCQDTHDWEISTALKMDLRHFVQHSLEYYYYQTLTEEEVDALKIRSMSSCTLL